MQTYGESVRQERACYPTAGNTTCKDLYLNKGRDRHAEQGFYIADIERCAGRGRELRLAPRELPRCGSTMERSGMGCSSLICQALAGAAWPPGKVGTTTLKS